MVERFYGIEEVRGSNPLRSTNSLALVARLFVYYDLVDLKAGVATATRQALKKFQQKFTEGRIPSLYNLLMAYVPANNAYYHGNIIGAVVTYFRQHDALTPEKAIEMKTLDWASLGVIIPNPFWSGLYFIRKTADDKYWLDVERISSYPTYILKIVFFIIIGSLFFSFLIGVLAFLASSA